MVKKNIYSRKEESLYLLLLYIFVPQPRCYWEEEEEEKIHFMEKGGLDLYIRLLYSSLN